MKYSAPPDSNLLGETSDQLESNSFAPISGLEPL